MRVVTGDEGGLLKEVSVEQSSVVQTWGAYVDKTHGVTELAWSGADEASVLAGRSDGVIDIVGVADGNLVADMGDRRATGPIVGLGCVGSDVFFATESGAVELRAVDAFNAPSRVSWSTGRAISHMRCLEVGSGAVLASGGKDHDLKLWDLSGTSTFAARNVRNTMLDLQVPIHIRDLCFVGPSGDKVATATAHHQIRLYDTKAQRRPVLDISVGKHSFNTCTATPDGNAIIVGDAFGNLSLVDLRAPGRTLATFSGFAGAITDVAVHPTKPLVAAVGLDRFVRVHNTQTKSLVSKTYLKLRMSAVLFSAEGEIKQAAAPVQKPPRRKGDDDEDDDEEEEEVDEEAANEALWGSIRTASKKTEDGANVVSKKKKRTEEADKATPQKKSRADEATPKKKKRAEEADAAATPVKKQRPDAAAKKKRADEADKVTVPKKAKRSKAE